MRRSLLACMLALTPSIAAQKTDKPRKPKKKPVVIAPWPRLEATPKKFRVIPPLRIGPRGKIRPGLIGGFRLIDPKLKHNVFGPVARAPRAQQSLSAANAAIEKARAAGDRKSALRALADAQRALLEARKALFDAAAPKKPSAKKSKKAPKSK